MILKKPTSKSIKGRVSKVKNESIVVKQIKARTYTAKRKTALAVLTVIDSGINLYNGGPIPTSSELDYFINLAPLTPFKIFTRGGGLSAQLQASRLALAKYIVAEFPMLKSKLESIDPLILTSDGRQKEPKKAQCHGARATRQKSYR